MRHVLDQRIRYVTAQLEVRLHYGAITAYNASGSGGKATGGDRPPGEAQPPHDLFRAAYTACEDDQCRLGVCEAAEDMLKAVTSYTAPEVVEESWEQLAERIVDEGEGWSLSDVAYALKVSESQVRRARDQHGRDSAFGKFKVAERVPAVEERVVALAARYCSVRQIADQVGVSKSTVQRILKEAA